MSQPLLTLQTLPEELLQAILSNLDRHTLQTLSLVSKWSYQVATPPIWQSVTLTDCKTHVPLLDEMTDVHDDFPIIRKLALLVQKPHLAEHVHVLTHKCHLPPPGIFHELPTIPFASSTLSTDPRTVGLVVMAARVMRNVHTLRIILGHPNLTDALLRCFFAAERVARPDVVRVRKLWLENCRVSAGLAKYIDFHPYKLPLKLDFTGLESVRFRRLPLRPGTAFSDGDTARQWGYARGMRWMRGLADGSGRQYATTVNSLSEESQPGEDLVLWWREGSRSLNVPTAQGLVDDVGDDIFVEMHPLGPLYTHLLLFDEDTYKRLRRDGVSIPPSVLSLGNLTAIERAEMAYRGNWLDPDWSETPAVDEAWLKMQRERVSSTQAAITMLQNAGSTLTSLNLDWVLNIPHLVNDTTRPKALRSWYSFYQSLFSCRFPHLRAFQFRNCDVPSTIMPDGVCLLGRSVAHIRDPTTALGLAGLEFMEAHENLHCLAWSMDHFFSDAGVEKDITERVSAVVNNLGRTLTDLRVDSRFSSYGEQHSEEDDCDNRSARSRRRLFITEFASKMRKVESIKIEGGMPRDEKREIVRALYRCPLQKIVMIGICSPIGNSWGANGVAMEDSLDLRDRYALEEEDVEAVYNFGHKPPQPPSQDFSFTPDYIWTGRPPMLHTLASYHASTITELKFCGYKGSSVLFHPMPITDSLLAPLRHFHNLETLIMSMYLPTNFEDSSRDSEVVDYWLSSRSPESTGLVPISNEEPVGWAKELAEKYVPERLAEKLTAFIGKYLSEEAKKRRGGVRARISFCLGEFGENFDVDLWIGKRSGEKIEMEDVCLKFEGPREELEEGRRREKLEGRRWF